MKRVKGEGKLLEIGEHRVRVVHGDDGGAYGAIEWLAPPELPGPPLHIHRETEESFYVLEGTAGFQVGEETVEGEVGAFVTVPPGLAHTYWNAGAVGAKLLILFAPAAFVRYFEALAEGLAAAGDADEAWVGVRERLGATYDIEVVGPPRSALDAK